MSGYLYYQSYYGYYIGIRISGTMGRLQRTMTSRRFPKITYYVWRGKQYKRRWVKPTYTNTPRQQQERDAYRNAILAWKSLTPTEKDYYRSLENGDNIKSGYNYFRSNYMKDFLK